MATIKMAFKLLIFFIVIICIYCNPKTKSNYKNNIIYTNICLDTTDEISLNNNILSVDSNILGKWFICNFVLIDPGQGVDGLDEIRATNQRDSTLLSNVALSLLGSNILITDHFIELNKKERCLFILEDTITTTLWDYYDVSHTHIRNPLSKQFKWDTKIKVFKTLCKNDLSLGIILIKHDSIYIEVDNCLLQIKRIEK